MPAHLSVLHHAADNRTTAERPARPSERSGVQQRPSPPPRRSESTREPLASAAMSKPLALAIAAVTAVIGFLAGTWLEQSGETGPRLPLRSTSTLPDDFPPPGVAADVRRILLKTDSLERTAELAALLRELGPEAKDDVRLAFDSVVLDLDDPELVLFGDWSARFQPKGTLFWAQGKFPTRQSRAVMRGLMRTWGQTDPLAAIAATAAAPNGTTARRWVDHILRGWDESVHDGALEYAESLGPGESRQWALYVVARRRVLRDGPEAAIAWAEALPDTDRTFKLNAVRRVAAAVADVDPQLAASFVERHLGGPYGSLVARRVGMRWAPRDGAAAMAWLAALPEGSERSDAVFESYRTWFESDPKSALAWLDASEPDAWLDPALAVKARWLARRDAPAAAALAARIQDADLRMRTIGATARIWLLQDEAAANAWLDGTGLDAATLERIRTIPEGMRRAYSEGANG